jgi:peptide/nickel transport system substrate-binding protein
MGLPRLQARVSFVTKWAPCVLVLMVLGGAQGCHRNKVKSVKATSQAAIESRGALPDPGAAVLATAQVLPLPGGEADSSSVAGGVLRVHIDAEPSQLNPLVDNSQLVARITEGLIYESLVECVRGEVQPSLAESWELSPDGLLLSLKLNPSVNWHDGKHLSVVDVQATFEPLLRITAKRPMLKSWLTDVEAVEIAPDRVVRFRLLRPSAQVLHSLCEIPILPAAAEIGTPFERAQFARQPVGTGPFRLSAWERGRRIKLIRNEAYSGAHKPFLDQIWFEIDTDGARAMTRTKRAQIDILPQVLSIHFPDQLEPVALGSQLNVFRLSPMRFAFVVLNTRRDPLSDTRFRWALSRLWQRERLAKDLHHGLARPLGGPPLGDRPATPFDREQASAALDEAGYRDLNADGVRDRGDTPLRLSFVHASGSKVVAKEAHQFALELRRAGILLDVTAIEPQAIMARLKEGNFDLAPLVWEGSPDEDPRSLFGADGVFNFGGYKSPQLDGLLGEWVLAKSTNERRAILARIGDLLASENPALFLYRFDTLALVNQRVRGLSAVGERFDFRRVWLSEGRDVPSDPSGPQDAK